MEDNKCTYVWNNWTQMDDLTELGYGLFVQGRSSELINDKNMKYFDGLSSMFNCNIGYGNERVKGGIYDQLNNLGSGTNHWCNLEPAQKLAEKLCSMTNGRYRHVFFTNSGSEATETAIKMVRQFFYNQKVNRRIILSLEGCYHGGTYGAMSLSPDENLMFGKMLDDFVQVDTFINRQNIGEQEREELVNHALKILEDKILELGSYKIAALFYEPVQLSNRCNIFPDSYIDGLYNLSRKYGFLLVVDEVATAFGRCGDMFQSSRHDFHSDIMLLAKGISSGYAALGAVMATREIFQGFITKDGDNRDKSFAHGSTTSGNPVACRTGLEVIKIIEEDGLVENSRKLGKILLDKILNIQKSYTYITSVQGKGLMISIRLDENFFTDMDIEEPAFFIHQFLKSKGMMIFVETDVKDTLTLAPPLIITLEDVERISKIIESVFKKVVTIREVKGID
ncbi:aminotransferase family protein [Clostridium perfringens]|uniref:aminotransferase family protein n=1 Tax=Clostridium perfringens TaxID=1502 RepID=UPI0039E7B4FC